VQAEVTNASDNTHIYEYAFTDAT